LRYPLLAITELGREVMHNRTIARLGSWQPAPPRKSLKDVPASAAPTALSPTPEQGALRQALRAWRSRKSQEMGVPPYTLFWDRTLDELCTRRPSTPEELADVWGIGEEKRRKFGAEILAVIAGCTE
jgi:ATP-dependent DNA helicase RecQ